MGKFNPRKARTSQRVNSRNSPQENGSPFAPTPVSAVSRISENWSDAEEMSSTSTLPVGSKIHSYFDVIAIAPATVTDDPGYSSRFSLASSSSVDEPNEANETQPETERSGSEIHASSSSGVSLASKDAGSQPGVPDDALISNINDSSSSGVSLASEDTGIEPGVPDDFRRTRRSARIIAARENAKKPEAVAPRARYRPPVAALKQIRKYKVSTGIPMESIRRVIKEITIRVTGCRDLKYQGLAIAALQAAAEAYCIGLFEDAYLLTLHCKRVTLMVRDVRLAARIRGNRY